MKPAACLTSSVAATSAAAVITLPAIGVTDVAEPPALREIRQTSEYEIQHVPYEIMRGHRLCLSDFRTLTAALKALEKLRRTC